KWDLIEKKTETSKAFEKHVHEKCAPFKDVPVLFISALEKQRIMQVVEGAEKVYLNRRKKISDEKLGEVMLPVIQAHQPSSEKGKMVEIYRVAQIPSNSPIFVFYCNLPKAIQESYSRFLENKLREKFDFCGVPMQIYFRKK
ncbi:MAG TPA: ribosome biogenesis GTPase Der, partial [Candidatus Nanoarchaeia archaeon]|nr:ribosome biogenesis GTPase Der [Candidatus Nanoarchaeia archaeon]